MGARRRCHSEEGVDRPYLLSGARCEGAALRATDLPRSVAYLQKPTSMIRSATAQFAVVLVILGAVGAQVTANGGELTCDADPGGRFYSTQMWEGLCGAPIADTAFRK